ncbi:hypothetical protein ISF_01094 [Cordyceps fumosorosea ARSEF 2679]|uniref:Beta-ketoacyl synthase n=1 Tax=Cordyceps fumosorosea (strain ARSEF 2679) TaxID=1081104 RepID=A0A168ETB6_CORFA|nr:hypothetical protein ISF_01094 [Cordyceps fumosorosea ARSEF 2679]OAA74193.1 hypothetical protein ISF_01094 [Cordyceps fumosorosea ARSEF 2679]
MASQPSPPDSQGLAQRKRQTFFSPELAELVFPPFKVGFWAGTAGVLAGVGGAIARDTNPFISGSVTGIQWFTLGTTFWFSRSLAMRAWGNQEVMKSSDRVIISTIAGSATGAVSGLLRGPTKIIPAMIMWGLLGAGGQMLVHRHEANQLKPKVENGPGFWSRLNPLRKLTDEEYMDMMREKKLKLDVDISLIDDRIAELRALEHKAREAESSTSPK